MMENKCKYIKEMERKSVRNRKIAISIIAVVIIICLILIHWNHIQYLFYDENREFSYSILWTAIGAIGTIIAFIGVVITILYNEKSREKQNKYEYMEKQLIEEQLELKKEVKKQLDIFNPNGVAIKIITLTNINDYMKAITYIYDYVSQIKQCSLHILWYFDEKNISYSFKLNEFLNILNKNTESISKTALEFSNYISEWFLNKELYNKYSELKVCNGLNDEFLDEYNKLSQIYTNPEKIKAKDEKIANFEKQLIQYSNEMMIPLMEKAKDMIEERNQLMRNKLNEIDKEGK